MATADEVRDLKARVSNALLAQNGVQVVDVEETAPGSYVLRIGISSADTPVGFPPELTHALAGAPVTFDIVQPFEKQ